MRNLAILLSAASVVAGCSSTPTPPSLRPAEVFIVNYRCDNGQQVTVRYFGDQGVAVLNQGGRNTEMNRVSNAPITYAAGQTRIVTDPNRIAITITTGFMAPVNCQSQSSSGTPPPPPRPGPPPPPPQPAPPPPPAEMRVSYNCSNGERISVRYFPQQGVASLNRGGQAVELQQQVTPPGFTYTSPSTVLRVQEDRMRLTMTVGKMAPTNCRAA